MKYPDAPLTGGTIVGLISIVVILFLCALSFTFFATRHPRRGYYDGITYGEKVTGLIFTSVVGLVSAGIWLWAMWPLAYEYHHWVPVSGTVQDVNKRIISSGDSGISQRFVVVIRGHQYGIDDTRASLLKEGSKVKLRCKKEYQFGVPRSAHGWACRWSS